MFARDPTPEQVRIDRQLRLARGQPGVQSNERRPEDARRLFEPSTHDPTTWYRVLTLWLCAIVLQPRRRSSPLQWRTLVFVYFTLFVPNVLQIQSITVDDMRQFLQRWERPDSAVLGIVGDFQPAQVRCAVLCCAVPC